MANKDIKDHSNLRKGPYGVDFTVAHKVVHDDLVPSRLAVGSNTESSLYIPKNGYR